MANQLSAGGLLNDDPWPTGTPGEVSGRAVGPAGRHADGAPGCGAGPSEGLSLHGWARTE